MPYRSVEELPEQVKDNLPKHAQSIFKEAFNNAFDEYQDPKKRRDPKEDPEKIAYIRSARSTLKYSQLGTLGTPPAFEEHKDGEIYAATMFELLELMKTAEPQMQFKRPAFGDGQPTKSITRGQESWERIFLGSLYLLGTTAPDTFVKARDAMTQGCSASVPSSVAGISMNCRSIGTSFAET